MNESHIRDLFKNQETLINLLRNELNDFKTEVNTDNIRLHKEIQNIHLTLTKVKIKFGMIATVFGSAGSTIPVLLKKMNII